MCLSEDKQNTTHKLKTLRSQDQIVKAPDVGVQKDSEGEGGEGKKGGAEREQAR